MIIRLALVASVWDISHSEGDDPPTPQFSMPWPRAFEISGQARPNCNSDDPAQKTCGPPGGPMRRKAAPGFGSPIQPATRWLPTEASSRVAQTTNANVVFPDMPGTELGAMTGCGFDPAGAEVGDADNLFTF